jgi:hypothetical protein
LSKIFVVKIYLPACDFVGSLLGSGPPFAGRWQPRLSRRDETATPDFPSNCGCVGSPKKKVGRRKEKFAHGGADLFGLCVPDGTDGLVSTRPAGDKSRSKKSQRTLAEWGPLRQNACL